MPKHVTMRLKRRTSPSRINGMTALSSVVNKASSLSSSSSSSSSASSLSKERSRLISFCTLLLVTTHVVLVQLYFSSHAIVMRAREASSQSSSSSLAASSSAITSHNTNHQLVMEHVLEQFFEHNSSSSSSSLKHNGTISTTIYNNNQMLQPNLRKAQQSAKTATASAAAPQTSLSSASSSFLFVLDDPWLHNRSAYFDTWYEQKGRKKGNLRPAADRDGPILDFVIAGNAKCGTTTLEANLAAQWAPMPVPKDICTPVHQSVYYAYKNWPAEYNNNTNATTISKPLRGTKCPREIHDMEAWAKYLPRTKVIVGIRHPVFWFQSFWNMQAQTKPRRYAKLSPYNFTKPCSSYCIDNCPDGQLFCVHRSQFHLALARLGKTALNITERQWLAPRNGYGGANFKGPSRRVPNPIFLYEQTQLFNDTAWKDLADFLQVPKIDNHLYEESVKKRKKANTINICDAIYDELRILLLEISYEMSVWLLDYFVPLANAAALGGNGEKKETRNDVTIADIDQFVRIVRENYRQDPCHRLERMDEIGTFRLKPELLSPQ